MLSCLKFSSVGKVVKEADASLRAHADWLDIVMQHTSVVQGIDRRIKITTVSAKATDIPTPRRT
jgi:hypothetical protein